LALFFSSHYFLEYELASYWPGSHYSLRPPFQILFLEVCVCCDVPNEIIAQIGGAVVLLEKANMLCDITGFSPDEDDLF
jgi:hypothetical protein